MNKGKKNRTNKENYEFNFYFHSNVSSVIYDLNESNVIEAIVILKVYTFSVF